MSQLKFSFAVQLDGRTSKIALHTRYTNNLFILIQPFCQLCHRCTAHLWALCFQKAVILLCALNVFTRQGGKKDQKIFKKKRNNNNNNFLGGHNKKSKTGIGK